MIFTVLSRHGGIIHLTTDPSQSDHIQDPRILCTGRRISAWYVPETPATSPQCARCQKRANAQPTGK